MKRKTKIKIKHVDDGTTDVIAKVWYGKEITLDYRFKGMDYTITLTDQQAIDLGLM